MRVLNKHGHSKTLVAAHPGNRNAVKSGVFSPAILAPHINAAQSAIEERPADDVIADVLRREIAALSVLATAMDEALEKGIVSRSGEPKNLVSLRLRANEKLRRSLEAYRVVVSARDSDDEPSAISSAEQDADDAAQSLAATIANAHARTSIAELAPSDVDPEEYLGALVSDATVPNRERQRARRLLTRRRKGRSPYCICSSAMVARHEFEFWKWIGEIREAGAETHKDDQWLAALVRTVARGDVPSPWMAYEYTKQAIGELVAEGARRAMALPDADEEESVSTAEEDPTVAPFWDLLLSADGAVSAKERLQAFEALDGTGVFPPCTCSPPASNPWETKTKDERRASLLRLLCQRSHRAARAVAHFPETSSALRAEIDAVIVAERQTARPGVERLSPRPVSVNSIMQTDFRPMRSDSHGNLEGFEA